MADPRIKLVFQSVRPLIEGDDGTAELLGVEGDTVRVRYAAVPNPECEGCTMTPEMVRDFLMEAFAAQNLRVGRVEVEAG